MTDYLLRKCGCGGDPYGFSLGGEHAIECDKCGMGTKLCSDVNKVVAAWNVAFWTTALAHPDTAASPEMAALLAWCEEKRRVADWRTMDGLVLVIEHIKTLRASQPTPPAEVTVEEIEKVIDPALPDQIPFFLLRAFHITRRAP